MAKEIVKHNQAPDHSWRRQSRASRRSRARSGRREHHGVLQGVQRGHPEGRRRRPARSSSPSTRTRASPSSPSSRRRPTSSRRWPTSPPVPASRTRRRSPRSPRQQLLEAAKLKMADLNANDLEAACRIIAGTARQMGIEIIGLILLSPSKPKPQRRRTANRFARTAPNHANTEANDTRRPPR